MILTDNGIPKYFIVRDILQGRERYVKDNAIFSLFANILYVEMTIGRISRKLR